MDAGPYWTRPREARNGPLDRFAVFRGGRPARGRTTYGGGESFAAVDDRRPVADGEGAGGWAIIKIMKRDKS